MSHRTTKTIVAVLAAGLLGLAGCSRSGPDQPLDDNALGLDEPMSNATDEIAPVETPTAEPTPAPDANAVAIAPPPEEPVKPDAQVLDDADATGMTARVTRDEAPAQEPATNDQAPQ